MFNSFKCILLCNRTATKFHNHFYITSVCHNHGREGEMRNLPGVFLSSRLPRLSRAQFFFFLGTSHVTIRPDRGIWSSGEIMKCSLLHSLFILKKNSLFHLIIPPKRTLFHELQISVTPFPSSGKPRHASSSRREFCYLWDWQVYWNTTIPFPYQLPDVPDPGLSHLKNKIK